MHHPRGSYCVTLPWRLMILSMSRFPDAPSHPLAPLPRPREASRASQKGYMALTPALSQREWERGVALPDRFRSIHREDGQIGKPAPPEQKPRQKSGRLGKFFCVLRKRLGARDMQNLAGKHRCTLPFFPVCFTWKKRTIFQLTIWRSAWNNKVCQLCLSSDGRPSLGTSGPREKTQPVEELTLVEALSWCVPRRQLLDGFFCCADGA